MRRVWALTLIIAILVRGPELQYAMGERRCDGVAALRHAVARGRLDLVYIYTAFLAGKGPNEEAPGLHPSPNKSAKTHQNTGVHHVSDQNCHLPHHTPKIPRPLLPGLVIR